jgi:hypothetical protein
MFGVITHLFLGIVEVFSLFLALRISYYHNFQEDRKKYVKFYLTLQLLASHIL